MPDSKSDLKNFAFGRGRTHCLHKEKRDKAEKIIKSYLDFVCLISRLVCQCDDRQNTAAMASANAAFKLDFIAPEGRFPTQLTIKCKIGGPKVFSKHLQVTQCVFYGAFSRICPDLLQCSNCETQELPAAFIAPPACGVFTRVSHESFPELPIGPISDFSNVSYPPHFQDGKFELKHMQ